MTRMSSYVFVTTARADLNHAWRALQPVLPQPKDNAGLANTDLSTKIRCFFRSSAHADIQLRAGPEVFPAHKIVLAAQSPTFERMFESGMVEQVTSSTIPSPIPSYPLPHAALPVQVTPIGAPAML